jgi:regulation of enolase protein 1 (concanavalin A-like superfamily)
MQEDLNVGGVGVRDRLKLYAEECQKKKDIENREKFDTQKLDASMSDITRFDSPTRNSKSMSYLGENIGKIESPGVFQFSPEDDPLETAKKNREKTAQMKKMKPGLALDADEDVSSSKPKGSGRTEMMRGRSFEEEDPPRRSSPPRMNNMRPGMMRGSSFDNDGDVPEKPQMVKNAEETKAKVDLADLLDQDSEASGKGKDTFQLKSFSTLRNGYINAIDDLRPESKPFSVQTKRERKKEAEKVKTYNILKGAWETYEDAAQDTPDPGDLAPEDEAAEEKIVVVETSVNKDWQEYAKEATKAIQENDDSDSDSDDEDEWDFWILEAKRLKAEAERKEAEEAAKQKAKAKAKRRKEKEAQRNRLEEEDEDIVEIAKRLKEEARKKKEDEKKDKAGAAKEEYVPPLPLESKPNSKAKGDNAEKTGKGKKSRFDDDSDDSDSDDAVDAKAKPNGKPGKGKKSRFDDDSDDSDSDDATSSKSENGGKPVKSESKEDSDDSDSDDAADTKAKPKGKPGKGKKSRFDDDSDDSDSDDATGSKSENGGKPVTSESKEDLDHNDSDDAADTKAKPNGKPGKGKKSRFDDDSDDSEDDAADAKAKPNDKPGKVKKGRFDDDSDDSEDDAADTKSKTEPIAKKKGYDDDTQITPAAEQKDKGDDDDSEISPATKEEDKGDGDDSEITPATKQKDEGDDDDSEITPATKQKDEGDDDDSEITPATKKKDKGDDDDSEITPATKKKGKVALKEDPLPSPRNPDGSLVWKNPLNRWTNKPKKKVKEVNSQIIFKVPEKTDCWRKTRHNFIMDNAPFMWQKVTGDFEAIVKVSGDFGRMYDKAGIMVREDEENWILTGMEFFNKRVNHSTCVTRDFTDWSLSPLPEGSEKKGIWFCIKRVGNSYETFYSLDSRRWIQTRQGVFSDKAILKVGICCACPMGDEFKVTFEGYKLRKS